MQFRFSVCPLKGEVVYSTCTVTKEENEEVIDYAVKHLNFKVLEQKYVYSESHLKFNDFNYDVQRFIPSIDRTLGYFIAKLQKT